MKRHHQLLLGIILCFSLILAHVYNDKRLKETKLSNLYLHHLRESAYNFELCSNEWRLFNYISGVSELYAAIGVCELQESGSHFYKNNVILLELYGVLRVSSIVSRNKILKTSELLNEISSQFEIYLNKNLLGVTAFESSFHKVRSLINEIKYEQTNRTN